MKTILYSNLTESAQRELNGYTQEIANFIIYKATENALSKKRINSREISASDLRDAKNQILVDDYINHKKNSRLQRMVRLIAFTGIAYASLGILLYAFQRYSADLTQNIGLLIGAIGLTISTSAMSIAYVIQYMSEAKMSKQSVRLSKYYFNDIVIQKWEMIETLSKNIIYKSINPYAKHTTTVNEIIKFLSEDLSLVSRDELSLLLRMRNNIIHQGTYLSPSEFQQTLKIADSVIYELKEKIANNKDNK